MTMYFNYFSQFKAINEAKKEMNEIKVLLLSNLNEESKSVPTIEKTFLKNAKDFKAIDINTCRLERVEDGSGDFLISDETTTDYVINSEDTVILTRRGVVKSTYTRDIVNDLEDANFFVVNTLESIMACENKFTTTKILQDAGLPVPRTALIDGEEFVDKALERVGGKFPVILKTLSGSQGIGVSIIDSLASLKSVLQTLWKLNGKTEVLIQEKIESDHDLRIHVLTRRFNSPKPEDSDSVLLGYMRRNRIEKDFRTNHSLGGTVEKTKLTKEQEELAIAAAIALGCNWCGVDIIVDKKTGKNYILEVNASPGTSGLKKATGIDVLKDVAKFVLDKDNWLRNRKVIGFREVIVLPGICEIVGKFDTGNGALSSSLTYDTIDVDEDKKHVKWTLGKHEFKSDIIGWSAAEVGDKVHDRPIVEIDIEFGGKLYRDVHVSLVDRSDKSTKFLANRKFMERIGCSVSASRTFVATKFDGEYAAGETKSDKHGGIKFYKK